VGISKKNKRKLVFKGEDYYWWVTDEFDGVGRMQTVNIASEDKKFLVKHYVYQTKPLTRHIIIIGNRFPGLEKKTGNWERIICPDFFVEAKSKIISPKIVETLVKWCVKPNKEIKFVDFEGKESEPRSI
jgi:hypothetical protein